MLNTSALFIAVLLGLSLAAVAQMYQRPRDVRRIEPCELSYRLPINHAEARDMVVLPGIGPRLAQRVAAYRDAHGPIVELEQLRKVPGIGPRTLRRLAPWISFDLDPPQLPR